MTALTLEEAPISPKVIDVPVLPGDTWWREFVVYPATQSEPMDVSGWVWTAKLGAAAVTVDPSNAGLGRVEVTISPAVTGAAKSGDRFVLVGTLGADVRTFVTGVAEVGYEGSSIKTSTIQELHSDVRVDVYAAPRGDKGADGRVAEIPGDSFIAEQIGTPGKSSRSAVAAAMAAVQADSASQFAMDQAGTYAGKPSVEVVRSTQARKMLGVFSGLADTSVPFDIMFMGTSLLAGVNSGGTRFMTSQRLLTQLRERFGQPGVVGGFGWLSGAETFGGPALTGSTLRMDYGPANRSTRLAVGATATWTNQYCTSIEVDFRFEAADAVTISVDGGAAMPVSPGASSRYTWASGALAAGNHTIVITSTNGTPILLGAMSYNGDETAGIRQWHFARSGQKSDDILSARGGSEDWLTYVGSRFAPKLIVIDTYIANDAPAISAAQHKVNIQSLVSKTLAAAPAAQVVLVSMHRRVTATPVLLDSWDAYVQADREIAAGNAGVTHFNMDALIDIAVPYGFLNGDTYHPGAAGQEVVADLLFEFIAPPGSPTGGQRERVVRGASRVYGQDNVVTSSVRPAPGQTADIVNITDISGVTKYLNIDYTGKVTIPNLYAAGAMRIDASDGAVRDLIFTKDGVSQVIFRLDASSPSKFQLLTRNDDGSAAATVFSITRSNGRIVWQEGQVFSIGATTGMQIGLTGEKVGFLGASAKVRQTVPAAATDATTTQALVNSIRTALVNFGLVS